MVRYLAKVKETFQLQNRLVVVTDTTFDPDYRIGSKVELRCPDGSILNSPNSQEFIASSMESNIEERPVCISFPGLHKSDVPIGTEVWLLDQAPSLG